MLAQAVAAARDADVVVLIVGESADSGVESRDRSSTKLAAEFVNSMRNHGVLISATGVQGQTLKIRPPLVFGEEHIPPFMAAFDAALTDIQQSA